MSVLPLMMLAAGTVISAIGKIREGTQTSNAELYNAQLAEANAKAAQTSAAFQAETTTKQADIEKAQILREKAKTLSEQRAAYAKAGVRLDEGTPLDVMADTASQYELDIATNRYNLATGLETLRYNTAVNVAKSQSEAEYRRRLAKSAKTSGYLNAGSTLLTGAYGYGKAAGWVK